MNSILHTFFVVVALSAAFLFTGYAASSASKSPAIARTETFKLYLDDDFTSSEREDVYNAARLWEDASGGAVRFEFITQSVEMDLFDLDSMKNMIWRAEPGNSTLYIFELFNIGVQIIGYAPIGQYIVLVPNRAASRQQFEAVVAHELGHHIGLLHTPGVMDSMPRTPCISRHDLEQLCVLYDCGDDVSSSCP